MILTFTPLLMDLGRQREGQLSPSSGRVILNLSAQISTLIVAKMIL